MRERYSQSPVPQSRDCVAARDPYCVWDGDVNQCVSNPFSVDGNGEVTVNSTRYKQNIHSGNGGTEECMGIYITSSSLILTPFSLNLLTLCSPVISFLTPSSVLLLTLFSSLCSLQPNLTAVLKSRPSITSQFKWRCPAPTLTRYISCPEKCPVLIQAAF